MSTFKMPNAQTILLAILMSVSCPPAAVAQHPPGIGYMFPPGAQAGQTTEVVLGGYDWTPDMQVFVHDPRIQLEIIGSPGPVILPEPPYWSGKKSRRAPFPLPRETIARLTIPADVSPGIVKWQAANANGATAIGRLVVSHTANVMELDSRREPQQLATLPICISGQIKHIKEADEYRFTATTSGPVTCSTVARRIGSQLNAVIEIRNEASVLVADAADTAGNDTALTFFATAGESYTVAIYDLDFRGNRAFVYQLTMTPGPRVVAAIPSVGRHGETRTVELVGYGIATGQSRLESVTRDVAFPNDENSTSFPYQLKTEHGDCPPFLLQVSDQPQAEQTVSQLTLPVGITGVLDERFGEDRYQIVGKKDELWSIQVVSERIGSQVDVVLAIFNAEGKELARNDDQVGSTDAAIEFKVPADGDYQVSVTDISSHSGTRAATYHLSARRAQPGFSITAPELLNAPIGGKMNLAINVTRKAGFQDPIDIAISGLASGVTAPDKLQVAAKQKALKIELTVAADAAASAALVHLVGTATINETIVQRNAGPILVTTTIEPPFTIDAEGRDDVTKWPRGTTFPAPVLISRDENFDKEIVLEMTSKQGRHRQGISGPELIVNPDVTRILYPVYLPEWLETTRTSRMVVNGVARVADPQGNIRYSVSRQTTRMGFLPTGALLKISADVGEFQAKPGEQVSVPVSIDRSGRLTGPISLELLCDDSLQSIFVAKPKILASDVMHAVFSIAVASSSSGRTEHLLRIRATLLKEGHLPVISETSVLVELVD